MSKVLLSILIAANVLLFSGCASAPASESNAAPAAPVVAGQAPEKNIPKECISLIAAMKACDQAGGFTAWGCKKAAQMKFDCPTVEKFMR